MSMRAGLPAVALVLAPDGKQVAFRRGGDLYVVKTAGGRAKLLRRGGTGPTWGAR